MPKAVVVFDQVGFKQREPNEHVPNDRPPVAFAIRGEEVDLIPSEHDRLRALGAIGTEEDAARAARMSAVTPPDDFAQLAAEHRQAMKVESGTQDPEQAAAEGAHPDKVSELRDKQAAKDNLARQGSGAGSTATADERKAGEKADREAAEERKASRPPRGQSEPE